jgi:hypothetical protein
VLLELTVAVLSTGPEEIGVLVNVELEVLDERYKGELFKDALLIAALSIPRCSPPQAVIMSALKKMIVDFLLIKAAISIILSFCEFFSWESPHTS